MIIDRRTGKRISHAKHIGDIEYDLAQETTDVVIRDEEVPLIGNWSDYTGSGEADSRQQQMWAGITNEIDKSRANIEHGTKVDVKNEFGHRKQTHRLRVKKIYVKLD